LVTLLKLHDVEDAERFVGAIVTRSGLVLSWSDREDLEQFLLVQAWELSLRYEAGGISFSSFAGTTLRLRLVDWQRQRNGRTRWVFRDRVYERPRATLVSLDELDEPLATGSGDPAADSSPDLERLLTTGDRQRAEDLWTLGLQPPRRAA
jgi:hypothetical protein